MKQLLTTIITLSILATLNAQVGEGRIVEYKPAPGQYINIIPQYTDGDTQATIIQKANENIELGALITLGGYGGYVVVKFDTAVINAPDKFHFLIRGNAFNNSAEPGIVMVAKDDNNNGIADDQWYELAGSEYERSTTNYEITYYRPTVETEDTLSQYIHWRDNLGGVGYLPRIPTNKQSYYPLWIDEDSLSFKGTLLPNNSIDVNGDGSLYQLKSYSWGYADNQPNNLTDSISFKINWAVDDNGQSVHLDHINFVKIYTGINTVNGRIGEPSTEYAGIENLSPMAHTSVNITENSNLICYIEDGTIRIEGVANCEYQIYSISGKILSRGQGTSIDISNYLRGVYIIQIKTSKGTHCQKIII